MTRRTALIALLGSLHDLLPAPETATGAIQRKNVVARGFAPSRRQECETCQGRGRLANLRPCRACGGNDAKPGRGYRMVDDYDQTRRAIGAADTEAASSVRYVRCDRCAGSGRLSAYSRAEPSKDAPTCDRCAGRGSVAHFEPVRVPTLEPPPADPVELTLAMLARRERAGSYRELEAGLVALRHRWPLRHRLVVSVHVAQLLSVAELVPLDVRRLDSGLVFLEQRLPDPVRVPSWLAREAGREARKQALWRGRGPLHERARSERDREIMRLREVEGLTLAEVARRVGLQRSRVAEIVAAREANAVGQREEAA